MAIKKSRRRNSKTPAARRSRKITRLAARLAPLEERAEAEGKDAWEEDFPDGSIIVDGDRLPRIDPFADVPVPPGFRIETVVAVVTAIALTFTAFIAILIARQTG